MHLGPTAIVIVGDRELVKVVLSGPQERYRWGPVFKLPLGVFVGPTSMLVSDGDEHARRRSLVQPAFALRKLQAWRTLIVAELDRMIDDLPVGERFDLAPRVQATVRRIVVRVLFGDELAAGADDIGDRLGPASEYINRPMLRQFPHPLPVGRTRTGPRVDGARSTRASTRRSRAGGRAARRVDERSDVLDTLLATDGLTEQELKDQVVSLIGAGFDTTTATASWLVMRAATDAPVWDRLRAEAYR